MMESAFGLALLMAVALVPTGPSAAGAPAHAIDHVGIGAADLDRGIGFVEEKTGVKAAKGGVHPGRGTQNALMSLGSGSYLEIIAPVSGARVEGEEAELLKLADPKPVFFAVRSSGLEATSRLLKDGGFAVTSINAGSRERPDGTVLKWRTMGLTGPGLDAAPFFIEWDKATTHPSATSPGGCTLTKLEVSDRDTAALSRLFRLLALDIPVHTGDGQALRLTLSCPKGEVVFGP
jgi:hypothetical protein